MTSGIDIGLHPGRLNGQRDVRHPTLRHFLAVFGMDSVPPYPQPSRRVQYLATPIPLSNGDVW